MNIGYFYKPTVLTNARPGSRVMTEEIIDAGTVWLNTHSVLDLSMPFGGTKISGVGREFGNEALHACTETKAVCMRLRP